MLNKNLQHLRQLRGFTLVESAAYLNEILKVQIQSKFFQTKDKVFTYEREAKPVMPKKEILDAFCTLYQVTIEELTMGDVKNLDMNNRWNEVNNHLNEDAETYKVVSSTDVMLKQINDKLDLLIKLHNQTK